MIEVTNFILMRGKIHFILNYSSSPTLNPWRWSTGSGSLGGGSAGPGVAQLLGEAWLKSHPPGPGVCLPARTPPSTLRRSGGECEGLHLQTGRLRLLEANRLAPHLWHCEGWWVGCRPWLPDPTPCLLTTSAHRPASPWAWNSPSPGHSGTGHGAHQVEPAGIANPGPRGPGLP